MTSFPVVPEAFELVYQLLEISRCCAGERKVFEPHEELFTQFSDCTPGITGGSTKTRASCAVLGPLFPMNRQMVARCSGCCRMSAHNIGCRCSAARRRCSSKARCSSTVWSRDALAARRVNGSATAANMAAAPAALAAIHPATSCGVRRHRGPGQDPFRAAVRPAPGVAADRSWRLLLAMCWSQVRT